MPPGLDKHSHIAKPLSIRILPVLFTLTIPLFHTGCAHSHPHRTLCSPPGRSDECAVLIHGLAGFKFHMFRIQRTLNCAGLDTVNWGYPSRKKDLAQLAYRLHGLVEELDDNYAAVHYVTSSMGAIVLRRMLADYPQHKPGRIVMIAPPNNGSKVARKAFECPLLAHLLGPAAAELQDKDHLDATCAMPSAEVMVIAGTGGRGLFTPAAWLDVAFDGPNDGTLAVEETRLPHMSRFETVSAQHKNITWLKKVARLASEFISSPTSAPRRAGEACDEATPPYAAPVQAQAAR